MATRRLSKADAVNVMEKSWDCRISEVVDEVLGTYCVVPKDPAAPPAPALPTGDTPPPGVERHRTEGTRCDEGGRQRRIGQDGGQSRITRNDAYHLATMVLDCRIDRWTGGDKTVACSVPKSIKVPQ